MKCEKCQTEYWHPGPHDDGPCIDALVAQRDEARANGKMIAQAADRMRAHEQKQDDLIRKARAERDAARDRIILDGTKLDALGMKLQAFRHIVDLARAMDAKFDWDGWYSTAPADLDICKMHVALAALKPSEDT